MPASGGKPFTPPGKPAVKNGTAGATVNSFSVLTSVAVFASGLAPGDTYWANTYFLADGDTYPYASGQTQKVRDDGSVQFVFGLSFLTHGEAGVLTCWISDTYLGDPLPGPDGPALTSVKVP